MQKCALGRGKAGNDGLKANLLHFHCAGLRYLTPARQPVNKKIGLIFPAFVQQFPLRQSWQTRSMANQAPGASHKKQTPRTSLYRAQSSIGWCSFPKHSCPPSSLKSGHPVRPWWCTSLRIGIHALLTVPLSGLPSYWEKSPFTVGYFLHGPSLSSARVRLLCGVAIGL